MITVKFEFSKRFIFHADTKETGNRKIEVFFGRKAQRAGKSRLSVQNTVSAGKFLKTQVQRTGENHGDTCHNA